MLNKELTHIDPVEFFSKIPNKFKNICFLHSASKKNGQSFIGLEAKEKFKYKIGNKKNDFKNFIEKNTKLNRKIIGYFSYDLGLELYNLKSKAKNDLKLPDIYLLAFEDYISFEKNKTILNFKNKEFPNLIKTINSLKKIKEEKKYKNKNFKAIISEKEYKKAYKKIKNYIKKGDIYQINLTHRLEGKTTMPPRLLFQKIIEKNPVDFLAYIEGDGFEILSASPERFIKIKDKKIETCTIKGTRPRRKTKKEDEKLKEDLIKSEKEKAELNMITDLLRNDIGKIAKISTVKLEKNREIMKCPTVWHSYSKISGTIKDEIKEIDALISMLAGGSITGCPKKRAIEIIDELEPLNRGVYTGIIGYINPNQNMDFNIAIRTIIKKEENLYLNVGGGIVLDSTEKAEFQETLDKAASFMKILN